MTSSRVLIVDDDAEMREALGTFLSVQGHQCEFAAAALGVIDRLGLDAVVCDVRMEGMDGLELLDRVKRTHRELPFVVITAMSGVENAVDAIKRGAFEYLAKPCNLDQLRSAVLHAVEDRRRYKAADGTHAIATSMELVGDGPAMRSLQASIDFVASSSAPVVVSGETGVGKELVARAIHARGPRRNKPFIAVNTSAIPQDLLEAEIFGHVRGAFTSASQARKGLLTEADGGTLMLDEIGDMPSSLQPKLLRVLQFGDIRPVGSDKSHHVDVRVIAATHRDLPALVRDGRFREDLSFRLNVLPVFVPPLRERREDIPALAAHFLADALKRAPHSRVLSLGPEALRTLYGSALAWQRSRARHRHRTRRRFWHRRERRNAGSFVRVGRRMRPVPSLVSDPTHKYTTRLEPRIHRLGSRPNGREQRARRGDSRYRLVDALSLATRPARMTTSRA